MATKVPARNYWQIPFLEGLYWTDPGGSGTAYNTFEMVTGVAGDAASEYARIAMKFDPSSAPSWVSDGDLSEVDCLLFVYLGSDSSQSVQGVEIAQLTGTWDENSSAATMDGLSTGTPTASIEPLPSGKMTGWVVFPIPDTSDFMTNADGIVLIVPTGYNLSLYKILKDPAPFVRAYYQYPLDNTIASDSTDRLISDSIVENYLKSDVEYYLSSVIKQSHIFATEEDVEVEVGKHSSLKLWSRELSFPDTWNPQYRGRGSVALNNAVDIASHAGKLLEITARQRRGQSAPEIIGQSSAIIGEVEEDLARAECTLEDPISEAMGRYPYYRDYDAGDEDVNLADEDPLWAMITIFINGGGFPWSKFRQEDLVYLFRRFAGVWDGITYSTADMMEATIEGHVGNLGQLYGLCIGRGNDDSILIFNPVAYRPSMRVWELNLDPIVGDPVKNLKIRALKRNKQYNNISINSYKVSYPGAKLTRYDRVDSEYGITGLEGDFDTHKNAKSSLGAMLSHRLCGEAILVSFDFDCRSLSYEIGDQVKITYTRKGWSSTPFMVLRNNSTPIKGVSNMLLVRYPDAPWLHSTFENTGLQGLWTWHNWYTGSGTGANQAWTSGSGGSWSSGFGVSPRHHIEWQGMIGDLNNTIGSSNFAPEDTTDLCDLVDFMIAVTGDQDTSPYSSGRDPEYNQIFSFRNTSDAVIFGIHRIDVDPHNPESVDNTLFLGVTRNYLATTISWSQIVETSHGLGFDGEWLTYGIGIQWRNDEIRFYVNRNLIGTLTSIAKTGYDSGTRAIEIQVDTEQLIGPVRWIQDMDWIDEERVYGESGTDPVYP